MSNYRSTNTVQIPFDGDVVKLTVSRISFEDAMAMRSSAVAAAGETPQDLKAIVRKHVVSISGLSDADGVDIPLDVVFRDFYFAALVAKITESVLATGEIPEVDDRPFDKR